MQGRAVQDQSKTCDCNHHCVLFATGAQMRHALNGLFLSEGWAMPNISPWGDGITFDHHSTQHAHTIESPSIKAVLPTLTILKHVWWYWMFYLPSPPLPEPFGSNCHTHSAFKEEIICRTQPQAILVLTQELGYIFLSAIYWQLSIDYLHIYQQNTLITGCIHCPAC